MAETNNKIQFRDLKTKRPWRRYLPQPMFATPTFTDGNEPPYVPGLNVFEVVTQATFLSEYYPTGHRINSEMYYPNVWRTVTEKVIDPATGDYYVNENGEYETQEQTYCELVPRISFPFQQIIALTHIYHATTNDIQHELSVGEPTDKQSKLFEKMQAEWLLWGLEEAWYKSYKAREVTGDTAFVGFVENNHFSWRVFSFQEGDVLYPHFDSTGRLYMLARSTHQYNTDGNSVAEILEVWDDRTYRVYRQAEGSARTVVDRVRSMFGIDGYELISEASHGFPSIPAAYMRNNDGPGWSGSQGNIDDYELTFSQMAHNNQAFGEAILVTKSKGDMPIDITRGLNGTIKQIDMDAESEASFLEGQSASESYMKQLDKEEEMIYRGSNIVKSPTELKSGDTPASAIRLIFTPNMQRAEADLTECKDFISEMWRIFASAYGRINNCVVDAESLPVLSWGKVYIPQSESSIVADLVSLVNSKIISAQTAAERAPFYSKPGESKKIEAEDKKKRDADLLVELETIKASRKATQTSNNNNPNAAKTNTTAD